MELDHLAISGETRDAAFTHLRDVLGVVPQPGGAHAHFGTHNCLLGLRDGLYIEGIAVDPAAAPLPYARWFGLDGFAGAPRLTNWICRVDDIVAAVAAFPAAGEIVVLERGDFRWRMAVPASGKLPFDGCFPALMQWDGPHATSALQEQPLGLTTLRISHPEAEDLSELLAGWLTDHRVKISRGPAASIEAEIETPKGRVVLR